VAYVENKATMVNPLLRTDICNWWEQALKGKGKSWRWNDNAMDMDTVNTNASRGSWQGQYNQVAFLTNEEWKMLLKERWCFNCHTQGHMSKQCLKKGKVPAAPLARTTVAEAQTEPALAYDRPSEPRDEEGSQGNALDMI
jgi:hypothetical protein